MVNEVNVLFTKEDVIKVINKLTSYAVTLQWHDVKHVESWGWRHSYDCVFDARDYHDLSIVKQGTGQILNGFSTIEFYNKDYDVIASYSLPPRCIPVSTIEELKILVQSKVDLVLNPAFRKGIEFGEDCIIFLMGYPEGHMTSINGSKSVFTSALFE